MTLNRWKEGARTLGASVFVMTADERKILCLILALALLGLGAKVWHKQRKTPAVGAQPEQASGFPARGLGGTGEVRKLDVR